MWAWEQREPVAGCARSSKETGAGGASDQGRESQEMRSPGQQGAWAMSELSAFVGTLTCSL